jgi:hypothetical protein
MPPPAISTLKGFFFEDILQDSNVFEDFVVDCFGLDEDVKFWWHRHERYFRGI